MDVITNILKNPYIFLYLLIVIATQVLYHFWLKRQSKKITMQRHTQGLPDDVMLDHAVRLQDQQKEATIQSGLLLTTILITPFILIHFASHSSDTKHAEGISITFLLLLAWLIWSATNIAKTFLGGLAFKTMLAFQHPFQVGDRVTLQSHSGKVTSIGVFFVTLQTTNDDQINIPTSQLWNEALISANAGERASLCVLNFYLSPSTNKAQRQATENAIWDAIQASVYYDPAKPMQIYLTQNKHSIQLTAKAYVALTYNELLFSSDIARAFLDFASDNEIGLGSYQCLA